MESCFYRRDFYLSSIRRVARRRADRRKPVIAVAQLGLTKFQLSARLLRSQAPRYSAPGYTSVKAPFPR